MNGIKKQISRSGEIAGSVGVNVVAVSAIMERLFAWAASHNCELTEVERGIAIGLACSVVQVVWYNGRKLIVKYIGGLNV